MTDAVNIFWMRRDLRLHDNHGLFMALCADLPVVILFVFDTEIIAQLPEHDKRVRFIYHTLQHLNQQLSPHKAGVQAYHGTPKQAFEQLITQYSVNRVFANRDYEPYATHRDAQIQAWLSGKNIGFSMFKDHLIMEPNQIQNNAGQPYKVFTPYSRQWLSLLNQTTIETYPSEHKLNNLHSNLPPILPTLQQMGFTDGDGGFPQANTQSTLLQNYANTRNFPAEAGTSMVGPYLRFGTISIRQLVLKALELNANTYLNELIWREFYQMILFQFPYVEKNAFKPAYDRIEWQNNTDQLQRWQAGQTGYPLVDAGMRQLVTTGYMHNRVRMVVASFLVKHLLIDWRIGEAFFAQHLLDYELASNNGGWQWAAGSGTDAAPYFRIFNPESQLKKFDPEAHYVKKYVPEWGTKQYPKPIIDHSFARQRALDTYKKALKN